jgi:UDP-N-acetylmuramate dehydrogenase
MGAVALEKVIRGEIRLKEPMSRHTSFGIGGPVDYWVEPTDVEEIKHLLLWIRENSLPWMVIGNGSDLLFSDRGLPGVALSVKKACRGIDGQGEEVFVGGGENLSSLINWTIEHSLSGLEFTAGIPGTVGGAVVTNAGAFGTQISEKVERLWFLDGTGKEQVLFRKEIDFYYRGSSLPPNIVLTRVELKLKREQSPTIKLKVKETLEKRWQTQPLASASAGCIFKNPPGRSAGEVIDSLGLKGRRVGDAQVSLLHANFIINLGNARAQDVITLMEKIQLEVKSRLGLILEPEIKIVGC